MKTPAKAIQPRWRWGYRTAFLLLVSAAVYAPAQTWEGIPAEAAKPNAPVVREEADVPRGPVPRLGAHPDFSGYWIPARDAADRPVGNLGKDLPGYVLPFTPAGRAAHLNNVRATVDPVARCIIAGLPRQDTSGLPFQVVQGDERIAFLYWTTTYRIVPLDGRKHGDDPDPSFFGDEVGRWEGNTLVVDAIAFKSERTWADDNADPHSGAQHLIERWTRPDKGHLHLALTVIDPKYYARAIRYQRTWLLGDEQDQIPEYACEENNVDAAHQQPGPGPIGRNGERGHGQLAPLPPPPDSTHPAVTSIPQ